MLLILSFLIIFPFLTYYVSTALFYRRVNSNISGKNPPTLPYLIPGAFHALSLAYDGPQKYFATLLRSYGRFAPFAVRAGPRTFVVLTNPTHIKNAMKASMQVKTNVVSLPKYEDIFGMPKAILGLYANLGRNATGKAEIEYAHMNLPKKHFTGTSLTFNIDVYVSILSRTLNEKMFQVGFWTLIEDFATFFQQVISRCVMEALFGSAIFKTYPSLVKDYWKYDDAVDGYLPGLSRLLSSSAYEIPRNQLHQGIEKWLRANHSGSEFAKIEEHDPIWDAHKGSKFIQERDSVFAGIEAVNMKARAAEVLSVMYNSNSTVVPASFWTLIEILRKPHLVPNLLVDITQHYSAHSGEYDVAGIAETPLLQSVHKEIARLRTPTYLKTDLEDFGSQLDEQWTLPRGISVLAFSSDVALSTEAWAKARAPVLEQPLDVFWAERFLVPNRTSTEPKKDQSKIPKTKIGEFSVEGLKDLLPIFDIDSESSVGHHYPHAVRTATLAVLLTEFELQLCDPEAVDAAIPPLRTKSFGRVHMLDKVGVRIRKRTSNVTM